MTGLPGSSSSGFPKWLLGPVHLLPLTPGVLAILGYWRSSHHISIQGQQLLQHLLLRLLLSIQELVTSTRPPLSFVLLKFLARLAR